MGFKHFISGLWISLVAASIVPAGARAAITSADEQRGLVEALSGASHLGVGGLPDVLSQRFSDSAEIFYTARFLKAKYSELGIASQVLEYDPMDAYPYYYDNTAKTYRSYFARMVPVLQADFDGLCDGLLTPERLDVVLKRLQRVNMTQDAICAIIDNQRVEIYIRATIDHTAAATRKMLSERTLATWPNVVAMIETGHSEAGPRPLCVIGGHMDSVARDGGGRGPIISPATLAPGADDNGSGTAAVYTLARGLRDWIAAGNLSLPCDLAFVHFSGEEEGLIGSLAYARLQARRPILWMVNFDMIAYHSPKARERIFNVGYDQVFGKTMPAAFSGSTETLKALLIERSSFIYSSDQISFWDIGVPAISVSEQACSTEACENSFEFFNPTLHTPGDVAAILDYQFAADIIEHSFGGLKRLLANGIFH